LNHGKHYQRRYCVRLRFHSARRTTLPGSGVVARMGASPASPSSTALPGRETDQAHPSWSYVQPVADAPATAMVLSATTATIALSDAE